MKRKQLLMVNRGLFGAIALLHLWRALSGLELNIGSFSLPAWASFVAFLLAGLMCYQNYMEAL